jgi:RHS repeat-associated protein
MEWYFYGVDGRLIGTYVPGSYYGTLFGEQSTNVYFGGRTLQAQGQTGMKQDRLGTTSYTATAYAPYGDTGIFPPPYGDGLGFTGYYRDGTSTGLDYAQQRYYAPSIGRFTTADPYIASASTVNPQSWNRYAYVNNDPVNLRDPEGLEAESVDGCTWDPTTNTLNCWAPSSTMIVVFGPDAAWEEKKLRYTLGQWDSLNPARRLNLLELMVGGIADPYERAALIGKSVSRGDLSDCAGLALFAQGAAYTMGFNGDQMSGGFVAQFGVFVPANHLLVKAANSLDVSIASVTDYQLFTPKGGSGFASKYRDNDQFADQVHHFAAFFQFGYQMGALWGSVAAGISDSLPYNSGDIALGRAAAAIGADLRAGTSDGTSFGLGDVAGRISKLCGK